MAGSEPVLGKVGCVFCQRSIKGEFEETQHPLVIRFEPLDPVVPGHMLFLPRFHFVDASHSPVITGQTFEAASWYALDQGQEFNLITSAGVKAATQTILHLHVHYVPRIEGDELYLPWTGQKKLS